MVMNFVNGGAGINVISKHIGARVVVVDMGVIGGFEPMPGLLCKMIDFGTKNMAKGPAMTRQQAIDSIESGIEVVESEMRKGLDIIGTGDMGIGNTTASSAVFAAIAASLFPIRWGAAQGSMINSCCIKSRSLKSRLP
jgi:nicotinate-nucleotide--dimethylbenzimidazole phosphoribosyltransferase